MIEVFIIIIISIVIYSIGKLLFKVFISFSDYVDVVTLNTIAWMKNLIKNRRDKNKSKRLY